MAAYKNLIIGNVEVVFLRELIKEINLLCPYFFFNPFRTSKHGFVLQTKKEQRVSRHFFGGVVRFPVVMLLKSESGMRGITLVKKDKSS